MHARHIFHIGLAVTAILLGLKVGSRVIAMVQQNFASPIPTTIPIAASGGPTPGM